MRIKDKRLSKKKKYEIGYGGCFIGESGALYMNTPHFKIEGADLNCVNLVNGGFSYVEDSELVEAVKAKVVIE